VISDVALYRLSSVLNNDINCDSLCVGIGSWAVGDGVSVIVAGWNVGDGVSVTVEGWNVGDGVSVIVDVRDVGDGVSVIVDSPDAGDGVSVFEDSPDTRVSVTSVSLSDVVALLTIIEPWVDFDTMVLEPDVCTSNVSAVVSAAESLVIVVFLYVFTGCSPDVLIDWPSVVL